MVYVISKDGQPLMPCENVIARLLLKDGKAKVKRKCPFTIQLTYDSTTYTQNLTLGVDTGSGVIGTAVSDEEGHIYYMSKVIVRNDISDEMTQRREYRRNRRNRKTRYRPARWANRKNSFKSDRFSPSMISKFHSHIREIEYIKSILPIKTLVFETGKFDPHLMQHEGEAFNRHWGYQKGPNYGFANTREKVLDRDNYKCQYCHGKRKDSHLDVHHIVWRSNGGSNEEENLITLCHTCHVQLHQGKINLKAKGKVKGTLKHATQMNSIRIQLLKHYPEAIETFGFITKENRQKARLSKDHNFDACIIATAGSNPLFKTNICYVKRCIPKGDYQLTKGVRSEQKLPQGKIGGFKKFDKVLYLGKEYFIKGRMSSGYAILSDIYGTKADFSSAPKGQKTPKLSRLKRIGARHSWIITTEAVIPNIV